MQGRWSDEKIAADLVRRIRAGDEHAEEELVRRYSKGLLAMLRKRTRDRALSDDLHQETFRIVLERLREGSLEDPSKVARFLLRTARNLMLASRRRSSRHVEEEMAGDRPDPAPGQLACAVRREEARLVRRFLRELDNERDRKILLRFYLAEEGKTQICSDLGLTALQFNRVIFRARERFKRLLHERNVLSRQSAIAASSRTVLNRSAPNPEEGRDGDGGRKERRDGTPG